MKTIIFIRHGKSSWEYQVDDKDRPLKERGISDAHNVAKYLRNLGLQIDRCFSSPADRALHTCLIVLRTLRFNFEHFRVTDELYDFSGNGTLTFLKGLDDSFKSVLVFGHNYAFTSLVNMLGDEYIDNLPTAGMAILEIDVDHWKNLKKGTSKKIVFPKELR